VKNIKVSAKVDQFLEWGRGLGIPGRTLFQTWILANAVQEWLNATSKLLHVKASRSIMERNKENKVTGRVSET